MREMDNVLHTYSENPDSLLKLVKIINTKCDIIEKVLSKIRMANISDGSFASGGSKANDGSIVSTYSKGSSES